LGPPPAAWYRRAVISQWDEVARGEDLTQAEARSPSASGASSSWPGAEAHYGIAGTEEIVYVVSGSGPSGPHELSPEASAVRHKHPR
jgi:hypothetical protein